MEEKSQKGILGLGLDGTDGHVRITRGPNFRIIGGSQDTHESMQEKCVKFNEKLNERGKMMEELERNEFQDIASQCGMKIANPPLPREDETN